MNNIEKEIQRLFSEQVKRGLTPIVQKYSDVSGNELFCKVRFEDGDGKFIRPIHRNGTKYEIGEPAFNGEDKPLYRLPDIVEQPNDPVFVVEGEKAADALSDIGAIATTSGAAQSAKHADWSILKGRDIILWPDCDEVGEKYAKDVEDCLREIAKSIQIIDVAQLDLPAKGDAADWIEANPEADENKLFNLPCLSKEKSQEGKDDQLSGQESISTRIVKLAEARCKLFHDSEKVGYAAISIDGHTETWKIASESHKRWITKTFYKSTGTVPNSQSLSEALRALQAKAQFEGQKIDIAIRVTGNDQEIFVDLCDRKLVVLSGLMLKGGK